MRKNKKTKVKMMSLIQTPKSLFNNIKFSFGVFYFSLCSVLKMIGTTNQHALFLFFPFVSKDKISIYLNTPRHDLLTTKRLCNF